MHAYEIIILPVGGMCTPLKGDTIFGHFCWQVAYDDSLLEGGLEQNLAYYTERPFAVFSSAFPVAEKRHGEREYFFKRPDLPLDWVFPNKGKDRIEAMRDRKRQKTQKWVLVNESLDLDLSKNKYFSDLDLTHYFLRSGESFGCALDEQIGFSRILAQSHNTINRVTGTTGTGEFAPYVKHSTYFLPIATLAIFVVLDQQVTDIDRITKGMERIGKFGYGSDAGTGMGRFTVVGSREIRIETAKQANALYFLGPVAPKPGSFEAAFFSPFTRYGKHGDVLARASNPFKNPVIAADEGAVFVPRDTNDLTKSYWGTGLTGLSLAKPETVFQGYSMCLPFHLPGRWGGEK